MAPELIEKNLYDAKADVWSLAITAIEMAEMLPPHANVHPMRVLFIIPREPPPRLSKPERWSLHFHDFLSKALNKDPRARSGAAALLEHKFLKSAKSFSILAELVAFAVSEKDARAQAKLNESGIPPELDEVCQADAAPHCEG
jgi:serine/threonine protein kinase